MLDLGRNIAQHVSPPHRNLTALFRWPLRCTRGGVVRDLVLDHTCL